MKNIKLGELLQIIEPGEKICVKTTFNLFEGRVEDFIEGREYENMEAIVSSVWKSITYDSLFIEVIEVGL